MNAGDECRRVARNDKGLPKYDEVDANYVINKRGTDGNSERVEEALAVARMASRAGKKGWKEK